MIMDNDLKLQNRIQNACQRLRQEGYRITPQRLAIIEFVFRSREHPTVKGIYEALSERFPTMSLMTVYQTVHLLAALSEIAVAAAQSEHTHYDGAGMEPHPHLVCQSCGAVVDADPRSVPLEHWHPRTSDGLSTTQQGTWKVHRWRVEGLGLCPGCQRAEANSGHGQKKVPGGRRHSSQGTT